MKISTAVDSILACIEVSFDDECVLLLIVGGIAQVFIFLIKSKIESVLG